MHWICILKKEEEKRRAFYGTLICLFLFRFFFLHSNFIFIFNCNRTEFTIVYVLMAIVVNDFIYFVWFERRKKNALIIVKNELLNKTPIGITMIESRARPAWVQRTRRRRRRMKKSKNEETAKRQTTNDLNAPNEICERL